MSSHLLAEVEQVADHLVMIRQGRLVFQGSVAALVATQHPRIVLRTERPEDADVLADIAAALDWPATSTGRRGRPSRWPPGRRTTRRSPGPRS